MSASWDVAADLHTVIDTLRDGDVVDVQFGGTWYTHPVRVDGRQVIAGPVPVRYPSGVLALGFENLRRTG